MFLKAVVFPGLASILCCFVFTLATAPATAQGAEGSAISRELRGGSGDGGGGYYGGGGGDIFYCWAVMFACLFIAVAKCVYDSDQAATKKRAHACRLAGHSLSRTDCATLAMGHGGNTYKESWVCDLCDQKCFDRLAPIDRCRQCNVDFCQRCVARAGEQPIEIATIRAVEARSSARQSLLVGGTQPLIGQAIAHPSQAADVQPARQPVFMSVPVDGRPVQPGVAVATASGPTAPPQPVQDLKSLPVINITLRQGASVGELHAAYAAAVQECDGTVATVEREHAALTPKGVQSFDEPEPEAPDFSEPRWKPQADCDGLPAKERADWLIGNKGMSAEEAVDAVMKEFPSTFL